MLLPLVLAAHAADTGSGCDDPLQVVLTRPAPAQAEVPVDVAPVLVYQPCDAASVHVELFRTSDNQLVAEAFATVDPTRPVLRLDPPILQPRLGYALVSTPEGPGPVVSVGFTTGSRGARPLAAPPDAVIPAGVAWWDGSEVTADLVLAPAEDPDALSLLTLSSATAVNVPIWVGPGDAAEAHPVVAAPERPAAQCYTLTQWDGVGRAQARNLPCVPVQRPACGADPAALVVGLFPAALRRRRRAPPPVG